MKRLLSFILVLCFAALCAVPAVCAASTATTDSAAQPLPELDADFDVNLATTLIIIICSVVTLALLVICIILAKRNFHN